MDRYLVFDISNLLYRTFFANKREDVMTNAGLAHHSALQTLNMYFRKYNPTKTVMAFDRSSWRKAYTKSDLCISGRPYKGNRRQKMTPSESARYEKFIEHLNHFEEIMRDRTAVACLAGDLLEADDLVAGFVDLYAEDNEVIIISSDQDLIQLLRSDNVSLIDPATGNDRREILDDEYDGDVNYFLFHKCLRGDTGDNVMSALPRIRKTRIRKAYTDPYEQANLMAETWSMGVPDSVGYRKYRVKDLYEENKLLMDLSAQPEEIQDLITESITTTMADPGRYSHFHFLKFLGEYELKKISESIDNFVPMLSR